MNTSLSRRNFAQLVGGAAAAAALPSFAARPALAAVPTPGPVRLSANENPYGPSALAKEAMREAIDRSWRYPDVEFEELAADLAKLHGVSADSIVLGDGSSEILKLAADTLDRSKKLVIADPTFEALPMHAAVHNIEIVRIPLDAKYAHDVARMAAVKDAGLIYVCNPNNPTGSITPRAAVRELIESTTATVLVDEAYHHYATSSDYESVTPLIKTHPNLIVARTFSKIYAMAGLRCGYAVGQPQTVKRLGDEQQWDTMNIIALAAARASLRDADQVSKGRARNSATKSDVIAQLAKMGMDTIPSETNFIMVGLGRDAKPVIAALRDRGVHVGRLFPALPKHIRVTIGREGEMARFLEELKKV